MRTQWAQGGSVGGRGCVDDRIEGQQPSCCVIPRVCCSLVVTIVLKSVS